MNCRSVSPRVLWTLTFAAAAISSIARADAPTQEIGDFLAKGQAIVVSLEDGSADSAVIVSEIDAMLELAKPVVTAYGEVHTQCAAQLARVIELYPEIAVWTPQEIRQNIEGAAS
ncbi:MAG: hypothetical protein H7Y41_04680, partial [Hyphomonadaceae bacterium]|nr:hypothetical protein [Clostridia bacterium]